MWPGPQVAAGSATWHRSSADIRGPWLDARVCCAVVWANWEEMGWSGSGAIKGSGLIFSTSHRRWHWGQWEDGIITKAAILCPCVLFLSIEKSCQFACSFLTWVVPRNYRLLVIKVPPLQSGIMPPF